MQNAAYIVQDVWWNTCGRQDAGDLSPRAHAGTTYPRVKPQPACCDAFVFSPIGALYNCYGLFVVSRVWRCQPVLSSSSLDASQPVRFPWGTLLCRVCCVANLSCHAAFARGTPSKSSLPALCDVMFTIANLHCRPAFLRASHPILLPQIIPLRWKA